MHTCVFVPKWTPAGASTRPYLCPGRHAVACARIGAGVVLAVGGPLGDMYSAHVTAFPVGRAACVAVAQVVLGAVIALFGFRARAG